MFTGIQHVFIRHPYILVENTQNSGTGGGASVAGGFNALTVNNEIEDTHDLCSLAANVLTLQKGTYIVMAQIPIYNSNNALVRLYNNDDAGVEIEGTSGYFGGAVGHCFVNGTFILASAKALQFEYRVNNGDARGQGYNSGFGTEHYLQAHFWQVLS